MTKFPKSMGACADLLHEIKTQRLALQKQADLVEAKEKELKEHIIQNLSKEDTGAAGKLYRVSVIRKIVPKVEDWEAFYKFVKRTGNFDLMQRRVSDVAISERWDHKKEIPGVVRFQTVTLSLNKIG